MSRASALLQPEQARTLSELIGQPLPEHLRLFIGVEV
ncbi:MULTISPECIES: pyocin S6 family toxin immunity protein [unclassified Pseudomonas]